MTLSHYKGTQTAQNMPCFPLRNTRTVPMFKEFLDIIDLSGSDSRPNAV